jgi:hypothetical protein
VVPGLHDAPSSRHEQKKSVSNLLISVDEYRRAPAEAHAIDFANAIAARQ